MHRHVHKILLVWPDYQLPVENLTGRKAKLAWVASAILDRRKAKSFSWDIINDDLRASKSRKQQLTRLRSNPDALDPRSYIQLACMIANVSWQSVVEKYSSILFDEDKI
jgi:hypothetical protein